MNTFAFLFTGQGAQAVGMLNGFAGNPVVAQTVAEASDALGMAVVLGLSSEEVRAVCLEAAQGEVVEAVNFNEPTQIVIAGHAAAIDRACEIAKAKGAKRAMKLAVSAPFHSSLLKHASSRLRDYMADIAFSAPQIDLIN